MVHEAASQGFTNAAAVYEAARPGYPPEIVDTLLQILQPEPELFLLDLGAGTGKLTRELVSRGVQCLAAEPVLGMAAQFRRVLPETELVACTAERLPFRARSFTGVVVAQAFHWFRHEEALQEIHRTLCPGGKLALLWNVRDERHDCFAQLTELIRPYEGEGGVRIPRHRDGVWREPLERSRLFRPILTREAPLPQPITPDMLVGRVASTSFIAALPDLEREKVLDAVRTLAATHPSLAGRESFEFPYRCELSVYQAVL